MTLPAGTCRSACSIARCASSSTATSDAYASSSAPPSSGTVPVAKRRCATNCNHCVSLPPQCTHQHIRHRMVPRPVARDQGPHRAVHIILRVSAPCKQLLVAKVVRNDAAVQPHTRKRVVNDRGFDLRRGRRVPARQRINRRRRRRHTRSTARHRPRRTPRLRSAHEDIAEMQVCLLYTSPSPRDQRGSRMPSSA